MASVNSLCTTVQLGVGALALLLLVGLSRPTRAEAAYDKPIVGEHGMVASARLAASEAGLEMLKRGGNAVDAAAATQFVLNVVEPYASGIGGGQFFLLYVAAEDRVIAIDGREEAPYAFTEDAFLDENGNPIPFSPDRITGGNSVGVPGTLAAIAKALGLYGTMTLSEVMQPAIRIAEEGFILTEDDAEILTSNADRLKSFPASRALYFHSDGTPLQAGERLKNPDLADTFRLIAEQGPSVFYRGEIGEDIVDAVQNAPVNPGVMTQNDLSGYVAPLREPVKGAYRGYEVYGMSPPTSGGLTVIETLNILEGFDLGALGWGSADAVHLFTEAQKLAFGDRGRYIGDTDFVDVPIEGLLSKDFARARRSLMSPYEAIPVPAAPGSPYTGEALLAAAHEPLPDTEHVSTTHVSIDDSEGNMVAMTTTIEQYFGSGMVVPGRGFLLNNELTDFDAVPYRDDGTPVANRPEGGKALRQTTLDATETYGGKRPRSSMSPTLVLKDGEPYMTLGSPGGSRIIGIVLNVLTNMIDFGMDPQAAINAPRAINRNGALELEPQLYADGGLRTLLAARGHTVSESDPFGGAQAIVIDPETGKLLGGADPRRGGGVAAY